MEDGFEAMSKIMQERKEQTKKNQAKFLEDSKNRFARIAAKKIKTSFIGAIAEFEKNFGYLWGKNPPLTEEQVQILQALIEAGVDQEFFKIIWDTTRTAVLNNGNNQSRGLEQEIANYSMTWDRYRLNLPVVGGNLNTNSQEGKENVEPGN